jgi:hypothetical protein
LREFAEKVEGIELGAKQMNISEEYFQRIDRVMKETGGSADDVRKAFEKIADTLTKIETKSPGWERLEIEMAQLGVAGDDLKKNYQDVFAQIAKGLQGVDISQEQVAAGRETMGRGFDAMLRPLAIGGFESDFAKSGMVSPTDMAAVKGYNEDLRKLSAETAGFWNQAKTIGLGVWDQLLHGGGTDPAAVALHQAEILQSQGKEKKEGEENKKKTDEAAAKAREDAAKNIALKSAEKFRGEDAKKAAAIDRETEALRERNREAALSPEQKKLELTKQIKELQDDINSGYVAATRTEEAQMKKKLEELKHDLAGVKDTKPTAEHHAALSHMGNQAMGGILLGHDRLNDLAVHAKSTAKHTAQIAKNTAKASPGGKPREEYP